MELLLTFDPKVGRWITQVASERGEPLEDYVTEVILEALQDHRARKAWHTLCEKGYDDTHYSKRTNRTRAHPGKRRTGAATMVSRLRLSIGRRFHHLFSAKL